LNDSELESVENSTYIGASYIVLFDGMNEW